MSEQRINELKVQLRDALQRLSHEGAAATVHDAGALIEWDACYDHAKLLEDAAGFLPPGQDRSDLLMIAGELCALLPAPVAADPHPADTTATDAPPAV